MTEGKLRWIPITERLPKDEDYVLVSFENSTPSGHRADCPKTMIVE